MTEFIYVTIHLCRPIKSPMLRCGLISYYCSCNQHVLVPCRFSAYLYHAGGVDVLSAACINLHCSKLISHAGRVVLYWILVGCCSEKLELMARSTSPWVTILFYCQGVCLCHLLMLVLKKWEARYSVGMCAYGGLSAINLECI